MPAPIYEKVPTNTTATTTPTTTQSPSTRVVGGGRCGRWRTIALMIVLVLVPVIILAPQQQPIHTIDVSTVISPDSKLNSQTTPKSEVGGHHPKGDSPSTNQPNGADNGGTTRSPVPIDISLMKKLVHTTLIQPLLHTINTTIPQLLQYHIVATPSTMKEEDGYGANVINRVLEVAGYMPLVRISNSLSNSPLVLLTPTLAPATTASKTSSTSMELSLRETFAFSFDGASTTTATTTSRFPPLSSLAHDGVRSGELHLHQYIKLAGSSTEDPVIYLQTALTNALYRYRSALLRPYHQSNNKVGNSSSSFPSSSSTTMGASSSSSSLAKLMHGMAPLAAYQKFTASSSMFFSGTTSSSQNQHHQQVECLDPFIANRRSAAQKEYAKLKQLESISRREFEPFSILPPQPQVSPTTPLRASYQVLATNFAFMPLSKVLNNRVMSSDFEADVEHAGKMLAHLSTAGNTEIMTNATPVNTKVSWGSVAMPISPSLFTRRTLTTTTTIDGNPKDVVRAFRIRNCKEGNFTKKQLKAMAASKEMLVKLRGPTAYQSSRSFSSPSTTSSSFPPIELEAHQSSGVRPHLLPTMSHVVAAFPLPVLKGCPVMMPGIRPDAFCSPNLGRDWSSKSIVPLINNTSSSSTSTSKTLSQSQLLLRAAHLSTSATPIDDQYLPDGIPQLRSPRRGSSSASSSDPYASVKASSSVVLPISYALPSHMYDRGIKVVMALEAAASKVLGKPIYDDFERRYPSHNNSSGNIGDDDTEGRRQDAFITEVLSDTTTTPASTLALFKKFIKRDDVEEVKDKPCASIVPKDKGSYRFKDEGEYVREYSRSLYCITFKKGGWDVLRHYEIISSGCMPFMLDVDSIPSYTMYNYPKAIVFAARDLPGVTFDCAKMRVRIDFNVFPMITYIKLLRALMDHAKRFLTTRALAQYVLESSGHHGARKVLFLADYRHDLPLRSMGNYNTWMLYHGMKELLGPLNVIESTRLPFLFDQGNEGAQARVRDKLYGKGFGYAFKLPGEYGEETAEETAFGGPSGGSSSKSSSSSSLINKHKGRVIDVEDELGGNVIGKGAPTTTTATQPSPDGVAGGVEGDIFKSNTPVRGRIYQRILEREFDVIIYPDVIATTLKKQRSNLRYLDNIRRAGYTKKDVLFIHGPDIPYSPPRILGYYLDFLYENGIVFQREIADCERYLPPGDVLPGATKAGGGDEVIDTTSTTSSTDSESGSMWNDEGEQIMYDTAVGNDPRLPMSRGDMLKMCVWYRTRNCFDDVNIISNSALKKLPVSQLLSPVPPS